MFVRTRARGFSHLLRSHQHSEIFFLCKFFFKVKISVDFVVYHVPMNTVVDLSWTQAIVCSFAGGRKFIESTATF